MRGITRKPDFCTFVFATWIVQFLILLNPKFQATSLLLLLYRPVCVRTGQTPKTVFLASRLSIRLYMMIIEGVFSLGLAKLSGQFCSYVSLHFLNFKPVLFPTTTSFPFVLCCATQSLRPY